MTLFIPNTGQALVDPKTGHVTGPYRRWMQALNDWANTAASSTPTPAPEPVSFVVTGAGSIAASGSVAVGEFVVSLIGDRDHPLPTSFYGMTPDGEKGYTPLSAAIVAGTGILVTNSGYTAVDTVATPDDLPLTGNAGEAVLVTESDPGVYAWDGSAFTLDPAATGRVGVALDATADLIAYDNSTSGLIAEDVQAALDELAAGDVGGIGAQIGFARTVSTTTATTTNSIPLDNTVPQNTEGDAYSSLDTTITPGAALSLLEVEVDIPLISASTTANLAFALFRDSGANAIAATFIAIEAADRGRQLKLKAIVAAGSTSATTFKLRWGASTGTGTILRTNTTSAFLGGVIAATMTIREIKQ